MVQAMSTSRLTVAVRGKPAGMLHRVFGRILETGHPHHGLGHDGQSGAGLG